MMEDQTSNTAIILQFLRSLPMLEGVSQASLVALARASRLKLASKGTFIFFQSDPSDAVYLVWRGAIAIRLENPDGQELVINEMGLGDCFGELGTLTGQPRSASAEAIVDSAVLLIPASAFQAVLAQEFSLALRL